MAGYEVMPALEAAERGDVFVTVTGSRRVLRGEHFERMKDGAVLANAGHFDVELDLDELRALAVEVREVRPLIDQYTLADGRRLNLLARGRVVNLAAGEGHPAAVMDVSFALQALCVEELVRRRDELEPGVHPVPACDRSGGRRRSSWPRSGSRSTSRPTSSGTTANRGASTAWLMLRSAAWRRWVDPALRGGIDLGGTKIEAIVVDADNTVLGSARHPDARYRRACGRRHRDGRGDDGGVPRRPGSSPAAGRRRRRLARGGRRRDRRGLNARNLPDWEGSFRAGRDAPRELGTKAFVGNDVQVATNAEFALGAGRPYDSLLGVLWGTGVGGGLILDGKPWLGRGGAGEIGHMVVRITAAAARAAAEDAWRPTPAARRWRPGRASSTTRARAPTCSS